MAPEVLPAQNHKTKPAIPSVMPSRYVITDGAGVPKGTGNDELAVADESARKVAQESGCGMVLRRFRKRLSLVCTWVRGHDGALHRIVEVSL